MFNRLAQIEAKMGKRGLDFLQTHPSSESRVKVSTCSLPPRRIATQLGAVSGGTLARSLFHIGCQPGVRQY